MTGSVYSDTWAWNKQDEQQELVLNGWVKERLPATITSYALDRRRKDDIKRNRRYVEQVRTRTKQRDTSTS